MSQKQLNKNTLACLQGWVLDPEDLTDDELETLIEAQDYTIQYALVPAEFLIGLHYLKVFYIGPPNLSVEPLMPMVVHQNGTIMDLSIIPDSATDMVHILSPVIMSSRQQELWDQYFMEHEFQPNFNGLVNFICRTIANPANQEFYRTAMQHASIIING